MKRQNDRTPKEELLRSLGIQYATGDQWINNSRKNEGMEPKQKQYPVVNVTGDRSKGWCCKEQYCIGTWNVRFMNQGKWEVVKQEMTRVNVTIPGIRAQTDWSHSHRQLANLVIWTTASSNSVKLSHAMWVHPGWMGHGGEVWQNVVHWRRERLATSVFLPWEPHELYEKAKW